MRGSSLSVLNELDQDAVGALWVNESDPMASKAHSGGLVNELNPLSFELGKHLGDIGHGEGNMMEPLAAFFYEFRYGALGAGGLEQFDLGIAQREHTDFDLEL